MPQKIQKEVQHKKVEEKKAKQRRNKVERDRERVTKKEAEEAAANASGNTFNTRRSTFIAKGGRGWKGRARGMKRARSKRKEER